MTPLFVTTRGNGHGRVLVWLLHWILASRLMLLKDGGRGGLANAQSETAPHRSAIAAAARGSLSSFQGILLSVGIVGQGVVGDEVVTRKSTLALRKR